MGNKGLGEGERTSIEKAEQVELNDHGNDALVKLACQSLYFWMVGILEIDSIFDILCWVVAIFLAESVVFGEIYSRGDGCGSGNDGGDFIFIGHVHRLDGRLRL